MLRWALCCCEALASGAIAAVDGCHGIIGGEETAIGVAVAALDDSALDVGVIVCGEAATINGRDHCVG